MRLSEVRRFLEKRMKRFFEGERSKHPLPVFIWGPPGIGKSWTVRSLAKKFGVDFIDLRLSLLEPVDLRGLPRHEDGKVHWSRPVFLPESGKGILFLDELNTALPDVQNAALQLLLDRRVGEHKIGDGWFIVAAGNRREDGAHTYQLSSAVIGRCVHLRITRDDVISAEGVDEWCQWALENDVDEKVVGFIRFQPDYLLDLSPLKGDPESPFPSPRAWAELGWVREFEYAPSFVGEAAGVQFQSWLKVYERLPDVDGILRGLRVSVPSDPDVLIATITSLVKRTTADNAENVLAWILQLDDEYVVYYGKMIWPKLGNVIRGTKGGKALLDRVKDILFGGDEEVGG